MDSDIMDDDVFSPDNDSDGYVPEPKKTKPAVSKAKKLTQTTLKAKAPAKKRKVISDDEGNGDDSTGFSNTPPSSKKTKKAPAAKKSGGVPLAEVENDSIVLDSTPKPTGKKKTATETYQKLTQLEHIIKRPDTYIGSVESTEQQMWVLNKETQLMEYKTISFVPGFFKIFDEIMVNAADVKQRNDSMTYIKVSIDRKTGQISVENNGKGIPVEMHEKEKIYIPELIFGHLLAGSNFDDEEKKTVGGRNGYGAKLCNVFSTEFTLECQDSGNGKRYKQTWTDNMSKMGKAKITSNKTSDFVRITFMPDYKRFGMPDGIDDDLEGLLYRRVYDMAGTIRRIKVHLNGEVLKIPTFKAYCDMYAKSIAKERTAEEGGTPTCTVEIDKEKTHPRWEVGFAVSDGTFQQVSFVNNIATTSGGTHVNYIADQITASLLKTLNKRKKGHSLKQSHLRNHIFIFINCFIDNPAFTSQTKEQMTTKASLFGSKCVLGDQFLKKIASSEAIQNIIEDAEKKADKLMAKSDGSKRSRVSNTKLVEANLAGSRRGHECTLILTEGDSAKGLAVSGRAILDPDRIGVFPLRGKLLNVRDASIDQITKNQEIQNIKQFLGLKHKQTYTDTKSLRYGHLMIMADQDHDGSHIKGLLINFLQVQFPSLLQIPDFFREFVTPIMKVWQGSDPKKPTKLRSFFTQPEFNEWKEDHKHELGRWQSKYLKGLGSSSNEDAQVYFSNLDQHLKEFEVMKPEEANLFDLAFSKKKADARKEWLGNFVPGTFLDHGTKAITYTDFVNKELILFSMADNMRSIPSIADGLKPGQRKVLYSCFKKNLIKDKKVVELAGYVSEKSAYHHGEQSLQQTIIGMAQTFVGSNNINLLEPSGNFGSRLAGGSDAASPRYISTRLTPFARKIYVAADEPNLKHQYDDGNLIEPEVYAPIIPMILVNGADGIGTGWSTSIPNYHPTDIIKNLKRRMGRLDLKEDEGQPFEPMMPWFRGWKGTPEAAGPDRYKFNGIAYQNDQNPNEIVVTELPIRVWTDDFKTKLEKVVSGQEGPAWIKDYKEYNDHNIVHFEIMIDEKYTSKVLEEGLLERFKLQKQVATSNLVAFDVHGRIRKYEKVEDIMEDFYQYRMDLYFERKKYWLNFLHRDYRKLKNQARFVQEIISGVLVVSKKRKQVLVAELRDRKYEAFPPAKASPKEDEEALGQDSDGEDESSEAKESGARDYDYLLSMAIWSLTAERLEKLLAAVAKKKGEHDELQAKSEKDLWCEDLDAFVAEWDKQVALDAEIQTKIRRLGRRASKKIGAGKNRKAKDDDEYEPEKKSRAKGKAAATKPAAAKPKVESKSAQRFADMFSSKPRVKKESNADVVELSDNFSDDDFAALSRKPAAPKRPLAAVSATASTSQSPSEEPEARPRKRAAASKARTLFDDSESEKEDDDMVDVSSLVKGIRATTKKPSASPAPVTKSVSARSFQIDDDDDDVIASSPAAPTVSKDDIIDSLLSDGDKPQNPVLAIKKVARPKPAVTKTKPKAAVKPKAAASKASTLSPAAKMYAARKASALADDSDEDMAVPGSPSPKRAPVRARPGRAAAARRQVIVDEDDSLMAEDQDESDDPFEMDDDDD
ncbi:DNA topoisomerase 2 [Cordyceps fumosorosea ARSEF 2679]|uniref:DNA topoisomerase 2 n=1 Tax=Cordyceps fumosorosea (strain ARSEF 2679) TaxID=1081104 RepID=A0A167UAU6_CORFA|nr:DNA topoisomerase 2 [Cordyceps fumosorosea ARSEF 2679]OAA61395.1 DNA topoisomerase 2 [Cordyceps fumosorosea ARSEF 2679]